MSKYEFKRIGQDAALHAQYSQISEENMTKRALDSLFASGLNKTIMDHSRLEPKHVNLLVLKGYVTKNPSTCAIIIKPSAYEDWKKLCQET